jgi:hypothetical protein
MNMNKTAIELNQRDLDFKVLQTKGWNRLNNPIYRIALVSWHYTKKYIDYLNNMGNHIPYSDIGKIYHFSTHKQLKDGSVYAGNYYLTFEEAQTDFKERY